MTEELRQVDILIDESRVLLAEAWRQAVVSSLAGVSQEAAWAEFRSVFVRGWVLSSLLGRAAVISDLKRVGVPVEIENLPLVKSELPVKFGLADVLLTGPFVEAINALANRVPLLRRQVDRLTQVARARAFFVTGVESVEVTGKIRDRIAKQLDPDQAIDGIGEFADFLSSEDGVKLSESRVETIVRTNTMTALNDGINAQLTDRQAKPHVALFQLDEIRDRRTRGNPGGLYPDAGPHFQMDGFVAGADDPIWGVIWPPNGFNCRATVTPVTWRQARQLGFADDNNNLIHDAIRAHNGNRRGFVERGEYPDRGFASGPLGLAA